MRRIGFMPKKIVVLLSLIIVFVVACRPGSLIKSDQVVDDEPALAVDAPGSEPSGVTPPRISSSMAALSLPGGVSPVPVPFRGVNLSGAEFGSLLPGTEGTDYTWPTTAEVDYFMSKGMNTFRVNFVWERLQPTANGPLATAYAAKLEALVNYITSKGANVLLNPQNFARYYNNVIGSAQVPNSVFADFWRRVADTYKANPRVMFGLVNEPHDLPVTQWVDAANAAIVGIRATGATNLITVPNINYTGAWTWTNNGNGDAMLHIKDSGDNFVYEAHQYLDFDGSGAHPTCVSSTVGKDRIVNFVHWLRDNKKKGLFGEFAAANNTTCETAIKGMLQYMADNADVVVGWLWWSAGPWWPADYILSLEKRSDGTDAPQMAWLTPHLKKVTAKIRITYDWTNVPGFADGYCAEVDGYNWAGIRNVTLSYTDINLYDAVTYAEWNGTFSSHTGAARVTPPAGMIIAPNGNVKALGLCANKGPTAKKLTVTNIVGN